MCSILDHKPAFVEPGEPKNCSKRPNSGTLNSTNQKLKSDSTQAGINSSQIIKRSTRKKNIPAPLNLMTIEEDPLQTQQAQETKPIQPSQPSEQLTTHKLFTSSEPSAFGSLLK